MLTPSLVFAYWMRGSMAGILYASGLSLSRCHCRQAMAGTPAGTALINQHAERVGADMDAGRRDEPW